MFGVLGPLTVVLDGHRVAITAAKLRALLALLAAWRNTPVRVSRIVAELWPRDQPDSTTDNLRTYISTLRRLLGPHRGRLATCPGAYMLTLHDDELDAAVFEREASGARTEMAAGRLPEAIERYRAALRLWRGEPLQDVPAGPGLSSYAATLTDAGIRARQDYLVARFHNGDLDDALAGLRRLVADHPHREPLWHTLISLLYSVGDRSSALRTYQEARMGLARDLGLDPGPALVRLHADILKGTPRSAGPPGSGRYPTGTTRAVPAPPPRQLPAEPAILVGREQELGRLLAALASDGRSGTRVTRRPRIAGVHGIGGMGKSTLVLAAAHKVSRDYPDGQLYLDLRGSSPGQGPLPPAEALGRLLRALGAPPDRISPDLLEAAGLYRSMTADRRILLVIDNAVDAAQVGWLLPAGAGCAVLVTSRCRLDTLDGAEQMRLGPLQIGASVALLRALAGAERVDRDPAASEEVAHLCGLLPLALRIIGLRVARHAETDLRGVAARLRQEHSRLDELGLADLSVRATFEIGYRQLALAGGPGDLAARLFRLLGRLGLATFSPDVAAAILEVDEPAALRAIDLLMDHAMVERTGLDYQVHDLLRVYAVELAQRQDPPAEVEDAAARVARRFMAVVRNSRCLYEPADGDPPHHNDLADDPGVPQDMPAAEAWLARHAGSLGTLSRTLHASMRTRHLAWQLLHPLTRRLTASYPALYVQLCGPLMSGGAGDHLPERVRAWCALSTAHLFLQRHDDMVRYAGRAMDMVAHLDDDALRARVLSVYGTALARAGQPERAIGFLVEATARYHTLRRPVPVAICLINAAEIAFNLGWYDEALAMLRRSGAVLREVDGPFHLGALLDGFAKVHLRLGRPRTAVRYATESLAHSERQRSTFQRVHTLHWRSLAWHALGKSHEAESDARAAVEIARDGGGPELMLDAVRHLAAIYWLTGDDRAAETLARADALTPAPPAEAAGWPGPP